MKQLIIPALLALLIVGCSSTPDAPEQGGAPVEGRGAGVATVTAGGANGSNLPAILTDPKSILSKRSVYFDYDKYDVKSEYTELVTAHAKFLAEIHLQHVGRFARRGENFRGQHSPDAQFHLGEIVPADRVHQRAFPRRCTVMRVHSAMAANRLDGSAMPFPAISSAVPWSTATRG